MSFKAFFERYSYNSVKMFVRQMALSLFGLVLALIPSKDGSSLTVITSIFAAVFYLFLIYDAAYAIGSKDSVAVSFKPNKLTGLFVSLLANSLNLLLAVVFLVGVLFKPLENSFAVGVTQTGGICGIIALFIQGMYTGLLTVNVAGAPLNTYWFSYFLIVIPSLLVSTLGYYFGLNNMFALKIFRAATPEDEEIKNDEKRRRREEQED
ncbi:MAG: hypothetical protein IKA82_00700 [Clostridia bacterium]|nr:hypothetical protein [Clostridia bacterium]